MELTAGTFRSELHDVVANDEHAVSLFVARGEREGKTLEARNVLVTHVRNGKLAETWLFSGDQYAADEFLAGRWSVFVFLGESDGRAQDGPREGTEAAGSNGHGCPPGEGLRARNVPNDNVARSAHGPTRHACEKRDRDRGGNGQANSAANSI